jgi:hypothetical protein
VLVSTLTLALSALQQNNFRVKNVNRSHPTNYHIYYVKDGIDRVMLVPKQAQDLQKLQEEVLVLLSRNQSEQDKIGHLDGNK